MLESCSSNLPSSGGDGKLQLFKNRKVRLKRKGARNVLTRPRTNSSLEGSMCFQLQPILLLRASSKSLELQ
jgi:hypothetical protein